MSVSFDNATNNKAAVAALKESLQPVLDGELFHVPCVCHIINLIVQDGLAAAGDILLKMRGMTAFVNSSGPRTQHFKALCVQYNMPRRRPLTDVVHRWNSTYHMLLHILAYREVYTHLTAFPDGLPTPTEWQIATHLSEFLEVFYASTNLLSGTYYPTSPIAVIEILKMATMLTKWRYIEPFQEIVKEMDKKFNKYWKKLPVIFAVATCLDPRLKLHGVNVSIQEIARLMTYTDADTTRLIAKVSKTFEDLFNLYHNSADVRGRASSSTGQMYYAPYLKGLEHLVARQLPGEGTSNTAGSSTFSSFNEIGLYANSDHYSTLSMQEHVNFNLLNFWKQNQNMYKTLSQIARDVLPVQASTVASESAFSASGRVLDDRRSRLNPESLELCVCWKDYLDAKYREQDKAIDDRRSSDSDVEVLPDD